MSKFTTALAFSIGAAIGSVVTWYFVKDHYATLAQEEIDSVKEAFARFPKKKNGQSPDEAKKNAEFAREKPSITEYAKMLGGLNYTDYNSGTQEEQDESEEEIEVVKKETSSNEKKYPDPYVISPEEFGANEEYDIITFRYYSDHILADEDGQLIEDVEGCIGFESLNHFGEYEEDSVFVRNERLKTDFEILRDLGTYADVIKSKPYLRR